MEQITVFECRTGNTNGHLRIDEHKFKITPVSDEGKIIGLIYPKDKAEEKILLESGYLKNRKIVIRGEAPKPTEMETIVKETLAVKEVAENPIIAMLTEEQWKRVLNVIGGMPDKLLLIRDNILDIVSDVERDNTVIDKIEEGGDDVIDSRDEIEKEETPLVEVTANEEVALPDSMIAGEEFVRDITGGKNEILKVQTKKSKEK